MPHDASSAPRRRGTIASSAGATAVPNGAPERVLDGVLYVETVADGYAYGYVPASGGVGLDLRRIAL